MAGARSTALKALLRVEEEKGYSNLVLDAALGATARAASSTRFE